MTYSDFTLESAEAAFGLIARTKVIFPGLETIPVPNWLREQLDRGRSVVSLGSEKARSEILVAPVLLATRDLVTGPLAIFSGQRLDVDPSRGLIGVCDFILARTDTVPRLRAPLMAILEAKKGIIEDGLGQCVAQLVAARIFNERAGEPSRPLFGCVTTGDLWQFLRLDGADVALDPTLIPLGNLGVILATLRAIIAPETLE